MGGWNHTGASRHTSRLSEATMPAPLSIARSPVNCSEWFRSPIYFRRERVIWKKNVDENASFGSVCRLGLLRLPVEDEIQSCPWQKKGTSF